MITFLKIYLFFCMFILSLYILRHYIFTINRLLGKQRVSYGDIITSDYPSVSVLIPMHNEEKVAERILNLLIEVDYPKDKLEIIVINDHSEDKTGEIAESFKKKDPRIRVIHRNSGERGKPAALNDALEKSKGEIIIVFDADYMPSKDLIRNLAVNFKNPVVGAVMGRVIPVNARKNMLTMMLDLERTGGYQVDQQARYNLDLIPQYGGTVGGFRKDFIVSTGGFRKGILAEDTELTFRFYVNGYKIVYANRAECFEEVPEEWTVREKQIRRWSTGHNQVLFLYIWKLLRSDKLSLMQKIDGFLLLNVYLIPILLIGGILDSIVLFFAGEANILIYSYFWLSSTMFGTFGNFAPFYEISIGSVLDDSVKKIRLLPMLFFNFFFNTLYISLGFKDALYSLVKGDIPSWEKTKRYGDGQ